MTELRTDLQSREAGISLEVLLSGACLALGFAASSSFFADGSQTGLNFAVMAGWCAFGLAAGLVLDRHPGARDGRFFAALSLVPVAIVGWAVMRTASFPEAGDLVSASAELAGIQAGLVAVALPCVQCRPGTTARLVAAVATASVGAVLATVAQVGDLGAPTQAVAWVLIGAGAAGTWVEVLVQAGSGERTRRRRTTWLVCALAGSGSSVGSAWLWVDTDGASYVTLAGLILVALTVTRLRFLTVFRPIDEPALDAAAAVAALAAAGLISFLVWLGAVWIDLPSPGTPATFGGLLTLGVTGPAALWFRRAAMARRYGTGVISSSDVALITADLHARADPRDLLDKAARMVAAASASDDVRVVLGSDRPDMEPHEVLHPLVVAGDQVGALVVVPRGAEGLEPRQHQVIEQLVPTVALVARAVGLAIETEHARRDVTREREAERRRILNDLHDVLGPVLAGMSMRVQGAMRTQADPDVVRLLGDLASDLATSRADLRRMVSGLTPSALRDGGLQPALTKLLASFNGAVAGPRISLEYVVERPLPQDVEGAVYRLVAEGVTNAVRHASAQHVEVSVREDDCTISVGVSDDGTGGPVHPGVGLTSMTQRAEALGGTLNVGVSPSGGVDLRLEVPLAGRMR